MPRIFICYRKDDSIAYAGRLRDHLATEFGDGNVFMDLEGIAPGAEFEGVIKSNLSRVDVMLVIIGPHWLTAQAAGQRRLDDPEDILRHEIASGLSRGILLIPVLVGQARLPSPADLPDDLKKLCKHQYVEVTDSRWTFDTKRLIAAIHAVTTAPAEASRNSPETAPSAANTAPPAQSSDVTRLALRGWSWRRAPGIVAAVAVLVALGAWGVFTLTRSNTPAPPSAAAPAATTASPPGSASTTPSGSASNDPPPSPATTASARDEYDASFGTLMTCADQGVASAATGKSGPRPLLRLHVRGRCGFYDSDNRPIPGTAITAFPLLEMVAHGKVANAERFFEGAKGARFVRVLTMGKQRFGLTPDEGLRALPELLRIAERHGFYVLVVALSETGSYPNMDFEKRVAAIGRICAEMSACAAVQIVNEVDVAAEDVRLSDLQLLRRLKLSVPDSVPVALAADGTDDVDKHRTFRDADYITYHGDTLAMGSDEESAWRWVRRTHDQFTLADELQKYVWGVVSRRDDLSCDRQLAMGLITRLFVVGDTFHYAGGLRGDPPGGDESQAFACRVRGWRAIPDDWIGRYRSPSLPGSPVRSLKPSGAGKDAEASVAVRAYSSVNGSRAYTLLLGVSEREDVTDWADSVWTRKIVLADHGLQLWSLTRKPAK